MAENMSAWYELSWRKNKLIILIHRLAFEAVRQIQEWDERLAGLTKKEFSLPDYIFPAEADFGFGPVLKFLGLEREHWLAWECVLPAIDEDSEQWKRKMFALRATLYILFQRLQFLEVETGWMNQQLIIMDGFRVEKGIFGGSLSAVLTPAAVKWISKYPNHRFSPIIDAMKSMSRQMIRIDDACGGFCAESQPPKWINFCVPGNSCGLDPKDYYDESLARGYKLKPHNVDNGIQQLTLLAGLACLHDLARTDYFPR